VLTARAALRGGAGLVTVAPPESVYVPIAAQLTEALVRPQPAGAEEGYGAGALEALLRLADDCDVLAIGPGIGTASGTRDTVRGLVAAARVPLVIDADGLNLFAGAVDLLAAVGPPCILTPHPGEMARLLGSSTAEVQSDRVGAARSLAERTGAVVVLKGYRSLVCTPAGSVAVNPTGNAGMASGGTGDVLTGLLAALVGQGLEPAEAARAGVFLHGEAGDLAAAELGEVALIASDLIERLPAAMCRFAP
jgi:NAD(P)H-hydrate epimerase